MSWQNTHRLEALLGTVALFSPVSHGRDEDEEEGDEDEVEEEKDEHLPPSIAPEFVALHTNGTVFRPSRRRLSTQSVNESPDRTERKRGGHGFSFERR